MNINDVALNFLEYRQRTVKEMRTKLIEKKYKEDEIETCIAFLLENRFLDDIQYGVSFIEMSLNKKRGVKRIETELKSKGLSSFDIEDALYEYENRFDVSLEQVQQENADLIAENILWDAKDPDKAIDKVYRKLAYNGYPSGIINAAMAKAREKIKNYD